ncbi:MAG: hypothetical protein ACR5K9_04245 [Wolbachia sp.]
MSGVNMTNDFINNSNSSDSSIFKAHIRAQDLSQQEKINEYKAAAEELFRKEFLERQEVENQACGHVDKMLSSVELKVEENEGSFTDGIDSLLAKLFKLFNFMDSELEMEADPQVYSVIQEKKEKDLLAAVIKFLHDKLKELVRKVFSKDLSLGEKIDNEIKELRAKLDGRGLSEEEFARVLERLEALQNLKLKIQMFLVGWVTPTTMLQKII